jgi:alkanesulfonate monooxygenase SsuD/methylene tetrahydromethanopterin reductase-like flavin-dependent oxidoreductase (luciferase family)
VKADIAEIDELKEKGRAVGRRPDVGCGASAYIATVRYGFVVPGGTPRELVDTIVAAERAGWDAAFVWEAAYGPDAWTVLAAAAERTSRIRLGTMLTPLPWRRPWKVASQVATLDQLSDGRAILAVGLGAPDVGTGQPVDSLDRAERAALLDDGLDLIDALWSGARTYDSPRYQLDFSGGPIGEFRPVQRPRPPVWVVGAWPRPKSMRRIARAADGILPNVIDPDHRAATPDDVRAITAWLAEHGGDGRTYDVIVEGTTPTDDAAARTVLEPWADAGATWWIEAQWVAPEGEDHAQLVRERLAAGPPAFAAEG